jgi:hypothetical protein
METAGNSQCLKELLRLSQALQHLAESNKQLSFSFGDSQDLERLLLLLLLGKAVAFCETWDR